MDNVNSETAENSLVIFSQASRMLAEADTIQKTKELKDLALTAADWAKRKGMGEEAIRYARSYALEAERKMGQLLKETERAKGTAGQLLGKDVSGSYIALPPDNKQPTLAELNISKRESSEAQKLAELPDEQFHEIKEAKKTKTQIFREMKREEIKQKVVEFPSGKYRVLYADPPWQYNDTCDDGAIQSGGARDHYRTMSISELCMLPVSDLADDNSVLFLWATSPMLPEALQVAKAWGFTYKASFIWDKVKHNMGHYNSVRHEFLLICTKGSCLPDSHELIDSVQSIERTEHSAKPEEFRAIIDKLYSNGKRIELFARRRVSNWSAWGDEVG